jgi:hypothetical protein
MQEEWAALCKHVQKIEEEYITTEHILDNIMEGIVIDQDSEGDSTESSSNDMPLCHCEV